MLTGKQRRRLNELESLPPEQRTADQKQELQDLQRLEVDTNIYFVSRDDTMPDGDDDGKRKKGGDINR